MMMKTKTKSNARLRALTLLPAVAVALLISNSSCVKNAQEQVDKTTQTDKVENLAVKVMGTDGKEIDFSKENAPLVIIDGEESSMESVKQEDIVEMSVLSDAAAKAQYGDRAANGVVLVTTKNAKETATASQNTIPAKLPEFEGGIENLYKMLAEKIRYPEDAMKDGVQGKVVVELTVGTNGEISNVKVLRGINESLDKEALAAIQRVKEAGGKFTPAYDAEGNPVVATFALPISFKLQ